MNELLLEPAAVAAMPSSRIRLCLLLLAATGCYVACTVVLRFGIVGVLVAGVFLFAAVIWALLYNLAPRATTYFTVLAVVGFPLMFSFLMMGLVRTRESTRRSHCGFNLAATAQDVRQLTELHPHKSFDEITRTAVPNWRPDLNSRPGDKPEPSAAREIWAAPVSVKESTPRSP